MVVVNEIVDKKAKTITLVTNYDFKRFDIVKHRERFHFEFIKNKNQSMGSCLFFNRFNGRKYYPKEIDVKSIDLKNKRIELRYN